MNRLRTHSRRHRTLLAVGLLDDRSVPATISIADATAVEGNTAIRFIDRFVAEGSGGLHASSVSHFGPDGNQDGVSDLYVPSAVTDQILRYDGASGAFIDAFVAT